MSSPMSQLVLDLIKNIKDISPADASEFSNAIKDSFESCSTFESYLTGISEKQYVHCLSTVLQNTAENAASDLSPYLWNPIVASLIKCISALAQRQPRGSTTGSLPLGPPSSSTRKTVPAPKPHPPKSGNPPPKKATKQPSTKPVQKEPSETSERKTGVKTPSAPSTKVSADTRLVAYSETRTVREKQPIAFFNQLKGTKGCPVTCKIASCVTCEKYFLRIPLTRCDDIRCHRPGHCTKSGWYPHVLPHIWAAINRAHTDKNLDVKIVGLPDARMPSLETDNAATSKDSFLPRKRKWTLSTVSETSDAESEASVKSMAYNTCVIGPYDPSCDPWRPTTPEIRANSTETME